MIDFDRETRGIERRKTNGNPNTARISRCGISKGSPPAPLLFYDCQRTVLR
ncbi:MAG: hypothetical protein WCK55_15745 [Verrucomicrobiota bacterium]